ASGLKFKMLMVDRRMALVPLDSGDVDSPALLVRSSALLDALHEFFEVLWANAAPMTVGKNGKLGESLSEDQPYEWAEDLLTLLAAGMNDKTIMSELDISASTLSRRIMKLSDLL